MKNLLIEKSEKTIEHYLLKIGFTLEKYNHNIYIFSLEKSNNIDTFCILMTVSIFSPNIILSSFYSIGPFGFSTRKRIYKWSIQELLLLKDVHAKIEKHYLVWLNISNHKS